MTLSYFLSGSSSSSSFSVSASVLATYCVYHKCIMALRPQTTWYPLAHWPTSSALVPSPLISQSQVSYKAVHGPSTYYFPDNLLKIQIPGDCQSEISQKEKNKYYILMHIAASLVAQMVVWNLKKIGIDDLIYTAE